MSSDSDFISQLTGLDELVQVIYQGSARFVIISSVDDASWTMSIGLTGDEGRWWRGRWTDKDVRNTLGAKISSILLESFTDRMVDAFVKGEITIDNWSPAKGAKFELVLGTAAKTPIRVPIHELSHEEAAAYATRILTEIALQAQSRRCRLHPSTSLSLDTSYMRGPIAGTSSSGQAVNRRTPSPVPGTKRDSPGKLKQKEKTTPEKTLKRKKEDKDKQIEHLTTQLAQEKAKRKGSAVMTKPTKLLPKPKASGTVSRPKGASLANPTKKARKYQALEFESDDE